MFQGNLSPFLKKEIYMSDIKKKSGVFLRIVLGILCLALVSIGFIFLTSQSDNASIMGRWSIQSATLLLFTLIGFFAAIWFLIKPVILEKKLTFLISRIPDFATGLLLTVLPLLLFVVWFLFPIPLLQRKVFVIGTVLLSLIPGLLVLSLYKTQRRKSAITGIVMMLFSITLAIVFSEVILKSFLPKSIFNPRFGLRPHQLTLLEVDLPGVTPGGELSTNVWGFRGEDPPEQWQESLTIVTVGGSTTANYYLDDKLTWSHVVQRRLREIYPETWVGNAGIPRHSTDTHLLFLREVLSQIKPDIALFLVGVNDMGPFLRGGSASNQERLPDSGIRQTLFSRSLILQLMYKLKIVYIDGAPVITQAVDPTFKEVPLIEEEAVLPLDLHDLLDEPDYYRRRILLLIQECRLLGITPVFMTQPILYEDNLHWRGIQEGTQWLGGSETPMSAATFALMLNTLNSDLIEVCTTENVAVFDLVPEIPHSSLYFYDVMHMTEAGAELVGVKASEFILAYLESENLFWQED